MCFNLYYHQDRKYNITKIESMKSSCDKQITLSIKPMFVGENKAIKMTQRFNKVHPIKATSSGV